MTKDDEEIFLYDNNNQDNSITLHRNNTQKYISNFAAKSNIIETGMKTFFNFIKTSNMKQTPINQEETADSHQVHNLLNKSQAI